MKALIGPILHGILGHTDQVRLARFGGFHAATLDDLIMAHREGFGDYGVSFEYGIHHAIESNKHPGIVERVSDVLYNHCNIDGRVPISILFGLEKSKALNILGKAKKVLNDDSTLLTGKKGRSVNILRHLDELDRGYHGRKGGAVIPPSIGGIGKADLFLGMADSNKWVAATVKSNAKKIRGGVGLRVGFVPADSEGIRSDKIHKDKGLIICPLPYDGDFMDQFDDTWRMVETLFRGNGKFTRASIPASHHHLARWLLKLRDVPVSGIIHSLEKAAPKRIVDLDCFRYQQIEALKYKPARKRASGPKLEQQTFKEVSMIFAPEPMFK